MDLIGPYTIKAKDKTQIDFMCSTMMDLATSWFEIAEFLVSQLHKLDVPMGTQGRKGKDTQIQSKQSYFDKSSATVGNLITGPGLAVTHVVTLSTATEVNSNFTSTPSMIHTV